MDAAHASAARRKIAIGTAQFGLDYGINNTSGKVKPAEVRGILTAARAAGIDLLDTAGAYGDAERVLGSLRGVTAPFRIVSKVSPKAVTPKTVRESVETSLRDLGVSRLYGLLVHDVAAFMVDDANWNVLKAFQASGIVQKIGVSTYRPIELAGVMERELPIQLVQFPFSVFDRRFDSLMPRLRAAGIEVHVRSVFLQGLFFVAPGQLKPHFKPVAAKIHRLQEIARTNDVPLATLLLSVALSDSRIDQVVVGVDSLADLQENLAAADDPEIGVALSGLLSDLEEEDESILLPFKWPCDA